RTPSRNSNHTRNSAAAQDVPDATLMTRLHSLPSFADQITPAREMRRGGRFPMLRSVENEYQRKMLLKYLEGQKLPYTVEIQTGRKRSTEQNKTQRMWVKEISEQTGMTPEEVRAFCKLTIGVPILREENETFREKYDA